MTNRKDAIAAQDDFDVEPIPGLPEALPEGERILWAGAPRARAIALDVFHLRAVAIYALVIVLWRFITTLYDGGTVADAVLNAAILSAVFAVGLCLLALLALSTARSTRYTITNERVVMRIGVALTLTLNLPFRQIVSADYRDAPFGTGAIALTVAPNAKLSYAILWPHARPFRMARPQPMLRGINDGPHVARILAAALTASRGVAAPRIHVTGRTAGRPAQAAA
ncbi:MAG: photosynthetic complex putative assembly protein PuhB [Pseudomonadota bacterium]